MTGTVVQAGDRGRVDDVALVAAASMRGTKARTPWITPQRFTPITHCQSASVCSCDGAAPPTPALLQSTWTAPNARGLARPAPRRPRPARRRRASPDGRRPAAQRGRRALERVGLDVGQDDLHALGGEALRQRQPMPLAAPVTTATRSLKGFTAGAGGKLNTLAGSVVPRRGRGAGAAPWPARTARPPEAGPASGRRAVARPGGRP